MSSDQKRGFGLFRHRDFRHLWVADAISQVGTRTGGIAVSLLVVVTLHASTLEVSVLRTVQTLAYLLIGLQALCPPHLLGRMNATMNFLYWGAAPVGSLVAGVLATGIGPRAMLWVIGAGMLLAAVPLLASPLRRMIDLPTDEAERASP